MNTPTQTPAARPEHKLSIALYRDKTSPNGFQLAIENSTGGYRIAGPKFIGQSVELQRHYLNERDAGEIRAMLERQFPIGFAEMFRKAEDHARLQASNKALREALSFLLSLDINELIDREVMSELNENRAEREVYLAGELARARAALQ